ncbi:ankyrin repeat domain-containing protein [Fulvivirgaceae bacterium PWU4]|uniref:Ankyrin repeat domain-containing protein n=1 Tax=Chryseosolibacter histidini TaxID=2782349 RepID=A0AAP2GHT0_9BACT|nr:ankyrin repeat domain-containing protein [Chryseosolibacter histidini]MBT1696381.1 ankyrin repeat domain-containing protein [Chryseosolibacter histidini]
MKTLISTSGCLIFLALLLITVTACNDKKESASENNATASQQKVEPPQIDIHTAVVTGNLDAVKQHIAAGTNLNEKDPFGGSSPLISAAVFGKTAEAQALIEAGADLNFKNNDGSTALHSSAFFCRPEIVKMLLDKGADKTIKNNYGATAYETVAGPFTDVKSIYDMMGKVLEPMGLKLDYAYLEKTRPEIAAMLK